MSEPFTARPCGTTGHEILDPDGNVVAWTLDELWALLIVRALNFTLSHESVASSDLSLARSSDQYENDRGDTHGT